MPDAVQGWELGHIGQGHNIQGTLCSRSATSKNVRLGTNQSGAHQPCIAHLRCGSSDRDVVYFMGRCVDSLGMRSSQGHVVCLMKRYLLVLGGASSCEEVLAQIRRCELVLGCAS
jgi:hypothetical protein